jgi:PPOX class probable F420-dependent enzyme
MIPESYLDLVSDESRTFACLATVMEDGSPQNTPVWFQYTQDQIWINSARGRVKDENMRERPAVAILILDPVNPYRYLQIRGTVVEITEEGAAEHISWLSRKYTGHDYNLPAGQQRVIYRIRIDRTQPKA